MPKQAIVIFSMTILNNMIGCTISHRCIVLKCNAKSQDDCNLENTTRLK